MQLPHGIETMTEVQREKEPTDWGEAFSGRAYVPVLIHSKEQQELLKKWSYERSFEKVAFWNEKPVYMSCPILHSCSACREEGRKHIGHDVAWCRIYRKESAPKNQNPETQQKQDSNENPTSPGVLPILPTKMPNPWPLRWKT